MFNPKGNHLLDEQLAVSGLEMSVVITAGVALAGISAAASIGSGIAGMLGAKSANKRARSDADKARRTAKKIARIANRHNDKLDAADKKNYYAMREYSHDTNMKSWKYGRRIHNYKFAQSMREFEKNRQISSEQFDLNQTAFEKSVSAEKQSVEDMFLQQQFQSETALSTLKQTYFEQSLNKEEQNVELQRIRSQRNLGTAAIQNDVDQLMTQGSLAKESAMVDGLVSEGQASLGQAGKSRQKAKQSTLANLQRGIVSLSTELTGKRQAAAIELAKLNAETSLAETGIGLNIERINNAIANAESEAEYNGRVMEANMDSFINQAELNLEEIALRKQYADLNVKASMMLKPKNLPYAPKPEMPPERVFVKRMKVKPGATPSAPQQNIYAPLLSGIGNAAGALAGINFGGGGPTPTPQPRIPLNAN